MLRNALSTAAAGSAGGDYEISRSLRFNSADSAYLNRTPASAGNRKTWTWSGWVKRSSLSDVSGLALFAAYDNNTNRDVFRFRDFKLEFQFTNTITLTSTPVYRDVSAWYHIVLVLDTTQATSANRVKIYVNGEQITAFDAANYPSQNADGQINNNVIQYVGARSSTGTAEAFFNGYLADIHFVDGQALTPSSFGETDAVTGVWKPIAYEGTYGTNGFHLEFADNSDVTATTLGKDTSDNGNNWTPNNFYVGPGSTQAEKAGIDSLVDSPTRYGTDTGVGGEVRGNYCTLNPLESTGVTLTNGNLNASYNTTNWVSSKGTLSMTSGKWYFEATPLATWNFGHIGVFKTDVALPASGANGYFPVSASGWGYQTRGDLQNNDVNVGGGSAASSGDTMMVAVDIDAGKLWFGLNGSWFSSGDPATGANAIFTNLSGAMSPVVDVYNNTSGLAVNFGQRPFAYTAPSGFKALVTTNLPEPTVVQGDDHFNTVLYTGTDTPRSITGVGFQPDFVWIKARSVAYSHILYDVLRGTGGLKSLVSNSTAGEGDLSTLTNLSSYDSDGFSIGSPTGGPDLINRGSETFVAWNWKANGAGSLNEVGSIPSTVSANQTAGISIVTYTGTTNGTVGHGLGVAPSMIIVKSLGSQNWFIYHISNGATKYMTFSTDASTTNSGSWNDTAPTSSVFTTGSFFNGNSMVAYCFAEVEGFSKFGSYTGNNSADGPFIFTGFRPAFILVKVTSTTGYDWYLMDAKRPGYNVISNRLFPNLNIAEATTGDAQLDFLSNGFKLRSGNSNAAQTYIYAAFAENPFKNSLAR